MAEDHRRVEGRSIIGTGMATDPDRIRDIEEEHARRERQDQDRPAKSFAATLDEAPVTDEIDAAEEEDAPEALQASERSLDAEDLPEAPPVDLSGQELGETISSTELQQKLMRFRR